MVASARPSASPVTTTAAAISTVTSTPLRMSGQYCAIIAGLKNVSTNRSQAVMAWISPSSPFLPLPIVLHDGERDGGKLRRGAHWLPSPLRGGVGGGGDRIATRRVYTPTLTPPRQGEGNLP